MRRVSYQPDRLNPPRPEDDLLDDERRDDERRDEDRLELPDPKSGKPLGIIIDPPPIERFFRRRRCSRWRRSAAWRRRTSFSAIAIALAIRLIDCWAMFAAPL